MRSALKFLHLLSNCTGMAQPELRFVGAGASIDAMRDLAADSWLNNTGSKSHRTSSAGTAT